MHTHIGRSWKRDSGAYNYYFSVANSAESHRNREKKNVNIMHILIVMQMWQYYEWYGIIDQAKLISFSV